MKDSHATVYEGKEKAAGVIQATFVNIVVAHTGLEPVVSALRGQRVSRLHQCALADWNYRCRATRSASSTRQDRQVGLPGTDRVAVLLRHHADDLADVAEIMDDPGREQLTERDRAEFRMKATLSQ